MQRVKYEIEDRIAVITIDTPPANTLGEATLRELEVAIDTASDDETVKAIVLTGAGKMFVAGADIKEINNITSESEGKNTALLGQNLFNKIEQLNKPVIAAINGACLGGGMELAMACHIRIAAESAKFGQPEINLGLIPGFGGTQRLARLTNKGIAMEWILTGDLYSAQDAYRLGIINRIVPVENIVAEAKSLAHKLAAKSGKVMSLALKAINEGLEKTQTEGLKLEADLFGKVCMTEDKKEGVMAFIEKRTPNFNDK